MIGAAGSGGIPLFRSLDCLSLERGRSGELLALSRDDTLSAIEGCRSEFWDDGLWDLKGACGGA